jgi:hypothetical protein
MTATWRAIAKRLRFKIIFNYITYFLRSLLSASIYGWFLKTVCFGVILLHTHKAPSSSSSHLLFLSPLSAFHPEISILLMRPYSVFLLASSPFSRRCPPCTVMVVLALIALILFWWIMKFSVQIIFFVIALISFQWIM